MKRKLIKSLQLQEVRNSQINFLDLRNLICSMEPDRMHELQDNHSSWIARSVVEMRENQKTNYTIQRAKESNSFLAPIPIIKIDKPKKMIKSSSIGEIQMKQELEKERQLNPDEYFKTEICKTLKINQNKLAGDYLKKYLKNEKTDIKKTMESKERKEIKFQKDILKMKKKEPLFPAGFVKV